MIFRGTSLGCCVGGRPLNLVCLPFMRCSLSSFVRVSRPSNPVYFFVFY